jgi:thiol-disulfide isomerase/thioredoxin
MNDLIRRSFLTCLPIVSLAFIVASPALAEKSNTTQDNLIYAGLIVSISDEQGNAIDGVDVCAMEWTGRMEPYLPSKAIKKEGRFHIDNLDTKKTLHLRVMADGFATSMQSLASLTAGETREIHLKLTRPAMGWIYVVDPKGIPIEGAMISALQYSDANNNRVTITPETAISMGFHFASSDVNGRLSLPPLPKGFMSSVTVFHPEWQIGKANDIVIVDGPMSSLTLTSGVRVVCNLKQLETDVEDLEGKMVRVKMFSHSRSKTSPTDFIATVPVRSSQVSFSASAVDYSHFRLETDSHIVGPNLYNYPFSRDVQLDLSSGQSKVFHFRAQKKVRVKGRLIDSQGAGVADAFVSCSVAATEQTPWPSETKEKDQVAVDRQWTHAGSVRSDADGNYEVELTYGKTRLVVDRDGYFSDPAALEFIATPDSNFTIPDLVLYPVPKLRGRIINEDGSSVAGAYVRMRHTGFGVTDPVCESSDDGLFTLNPARIPNSADLGLLTDVSIVVMDAKTGKGGIAQVNLKDTTACESITVQLAPRSASWMLDVVKSSKSDDIQAEEAWQKYRESAIKKFLLGAPGTLVPSMREGTWLNTDAKSLEDFRGKFVLLDFWFIGCGPCYQDMPSIRMAHRRLSEYGFSVVSVHTNGQVPVDVKSFADKNGMDYPIVVDDSEGTIIQQFRGIGLLGFPYYILLDRQGRILHNDALSDGPSLSSYKFEKIYEAIRNATSE